MSLRILMVGDNMDFLQLDASTLRETGMRIYLSDNGDIVNELIDEVKPDLIFINCQHPGADSVDIYHRLLDNIRYASLPVIYTLAEDDVYLVNRKRTAVKEQRYIMSDNIRDAIKMALVNAASARKRVRLPQAPYQNIITAYRA